MPHAPVFLTYIAKIPFQLELFIHFISAVIDSIFTPPRRRYAIMLFVTHSVSGKLTNAFIRMSIKRAAWAWARGDPLEAIQIRRCI